MHLVWDSYDPYLGDTIDPYPGDTTIDPYLGDTTDPYPGDTTIDPSTQEYFSDLTHKISTDQSLRTIQLRFSLSEEHWEIHRQSESHESSFLLKG